MTRKQFLQHIVALAGCKAALAGSGTLGLANAASGKVDLRQTFSDVNRKTRVIVAGAGIAGLVCAYELTKAGLDVVLVEARRRVGGRVWTVRQNDRIEYDDGTRQVARFDAGLYFNAGAARIPTHHQTILHYCRELGVALEGSITTNRNTLFQPNGQQAALTLSQLTSSARGYVSELLAQCVARSGLNSELSANEQKQLLAFLETYGDLGENLRYPGAFSKGRSIMFDDDKSEGQDRIRIDRSVIFDRGSWLSMLHDESSENAPVMLQPVGGMDCIPNAFHARLGNRVRLGLEVQEISTGDTSAQITYVDHMRGGTGQMQADFLVLALPLPLLRGIRNNFSTDVRKALHSVKGSHANKVAWQCPRFWQSENHIYGGSSHLNSELQRIWYPSADFNGETGIVVSGYNEGDVARRFALKSLREQYASSRRGFECVHPGKGKELTSPLAISWHRIPYSMSPWMEGGAPASAADLTSLQAGCGRTYFAGDALWRPGAGYWQNAAANSARQTVNTILGRMANA